MGYEMGHAELPPAEFSSKNVGGVDIGHRPAEHTAGAGWKGAAGRWRRIGRDDVDDVGFCSAVGSRVWGIRGIAAATAAVTHFWLDFYVMTAKSNCLGDRDGGDL